jgi:acyl transferase domain-containing protein
MVEHRVFLDIACSVTEAHNEVGITMPSPTAQASLIRSTYARCGLDPTSDRDRPQYFEAHGTGTPTGDRKYHFKILQ